jgi:hypothetical protein
MRGRSMTNPRVAGIRLEEAKAKFAGDVARIIGAQSIIF